MKKITLPILLLTSMLVAGCSNGENPTSTTIEPSSSSTSVTPAPRKWGFYELKDGVDVSTLQGSPWLNTSIVGMVNKINKPSLKDDYFANVNYDVLSTNVIPEGQAKGGGIVFDTVKLVNDRLANIKESYQTYNSLKELLKTGAKSEAKAESDKLFNMSKSEFASIVSSKEFVRGSSPVLTITNDKGLPTVGLGSEADYESLIVNLALFILVGKTNDIPNVLADIAEAEGYDHDTFLAMAQGFLNDLGQFVLGVLQSGTTIIKTKVSNLSTVFSGALNVQKIVKELGLNDDDDIGYSSVSLTINSYIEENYKTVEGFAKLQKLFGIFKVFENRYLIGAENVKNLYAKKLAFTPIANNEITDGLSIDKVAEIIADEVFGLVVEKEYSLRHITTDARNKTKNLINEVVQGFTTVLENNDWLTNETKQKALEKMAAMRFEAFYSDSYESYAPFSYSSSKLLSVSDEYSEYRIHGLFNNAFGTDALHASNMPVTTVNAAYSATTNSFRIFHGIVAGFIDDELSTEELYGRIGTVIGHEITHGFDSTGSKYDKDGQMVNWWTPEDKAKFDEKVAKMADYYTNDLSVLKDKKMNGTILTGEITADMGGMKTMLGLAEKIDGFDYDKFFKNDAYFYNFSYTEDAVRTAIDNDPHPINYLRVNVTMAQFDKFNQVYDIKPGDGMYIAPENRVAIW